MQANSQEKPAEQKIVSVTRPQTADEIKKRRRDKEWIKWKAQPNPADYIRPIANPDEDEGKKTHTRAADFLAK